MYPIYLNLKNKLVVVVGGGKVATRKIGKLLEAKAKVKVVSPICTTEIEQLAASGQIEYHKKKYEPADLSHACLIIAATDDEATNLRIEQDKQEGQLVNVVNLPEKSDFFVPAVLKRGSLQIAISTQGASPSLAKQIKADLSETYDESYGDYVQFLDDCRRQIIDEVQNPSKRTALLKSLLHPNFLMLTRQQKDTERKELFLKLLKQ